MFFWLIVLFVCSTYPMEDTSNRLDLEMGLAEQNSLYPDIPLTYDVPIEQFSRGQLIRLRRGFVPPERDFSSTPHKDIEQPVDMHGYPSVIYRNWKDDWRWMWGSIDRGQCCCCQRFEEVSVGCAGCMFGPPSCPFPDACIRPLCGMCNKNFGRSTERSLPYVLCRIVLCLGFGCWASTL